MANLRVAAVASAMVFTIGFASASLAGSGERESYVGLRDPANSSLVIPVKSKHECKWKRVCDYFAPATSCSHPPCCKKSHHEKVCEEGPSEKQKSKDQANPGERSCPPGYIVLDKPNKYGAFCELAPLKEECSTTQKKGPDASQRTTFAEQCSSAHKGAIGCDELEGGAIKCCCRWNQGG